MVDSDRPSPLEPGYRIDRYELLYAVAQGGMGSVWVARLLGKHGFEKLYAIKTILPQYASDEKFRTMFLDEARIASGIDHPNVVQVLDLGEQHGVLYTVMEWVEGDSLARIYKLADREGKKLPLGVVLRAIADTCAGLHAAHELADEHGAPLEIVHRDVSPQNILVSVGGASKLIDFGVAKARDRLAGETSEAVLKGKVRYAAIEQILGNPVDRRADIWSMGAVLHTVLTGSCPFPGDSDVAILRAVLSGVEPNPVPSHVPAPLAAVIEKCLQRDRAYRFGSALEMQRAIEAAMSATGHACTASEVGTFVSDLTKDRIASRKSSLQLARRAVVERQRIRELLDKPQSPDPSGSDVGKAARSDPEAVTRAEHVSALRGQAKEGEVTGRTGGETETEASISLAGLRENAKRSYRGLFWGTALVVVFVLGAIGVALRSRASREVEVANAAAAPAVPETTVASIAPSDPALAATPPPVAPRVSASTAPMASDAPQVVQPAKRVTPRRTAPAVSAPRSAAAGSTSAGGELGGTIDSRK